MSVRRPPSAQEQPKDDLDDLGAPALRTLVRALQARDQASRGKQAKVMSRLSTTKSRLITLLAEGCQLVDAAARSRITEMDFQLGIH